MSFPLRVQKKIHQFVGTSHIHMIVRNWYQYPIPIHKNSGYLWISICTSISTQVCPVLQRDDGTMWHTTESLGTFFRSVITTAMSDHKTMHTIDSYCQRKFVLSLHTHIHIRCMECNVRYIICLILSQRPFHWLSKTVPKSVVHDWSDDGTSYCWLSDCKPVLPDCTIASRCPVVCHTVPSSFSQTGTPPLSLTSPTARTLPVPRLTVHFFAFH